MAGGEAGKAGDLLPEASRDQPPEAPELPEQQGGFLPSCLWSRGWSGLISAVEVWCSQIQGTSAACEITAVFCRESQRRKSDCLERQLLHDVKISVFGS